MIRKVGSIIVILMVLLNFSCTNFNKEEEKATPVKKEDTIKKESEEEPKEEISKKETEEEKDKTMEIKALLLKTDKNNRDIKADGEDKISFSFYNQDNKLIEDEKLKKEIKIFKDDKLYEKMGFKTEESGEYSFYAKYKDILSNKIEIKVTEIKKEKEIKELILKTDSEDNIIIADGNDDIELIFYDQDGEKIDNNKVQIYRGDTKYNKNKFVSKKVGRYILYGKYKDIESNRFEIIVEKVDKIAPEIVSVSIETDSKISPPDDIEVYFNEEVELEGLKKSIKLTSGETKISIDIKLDGKKIIIIPERLYYNKNYSLKILNEIYDLSENRLEKGKIINFSTISLERTFMKKISNGRFKMGDRVGNLWEEHRPVHAVEITYNFEIGIYEVTNRVYNFYLKEIGKDQELDDEKEDRSREIPVVDISWFEAIEYCNWLSDAQGLPKAYNKSGKLLDENGKVTQNIEEVIGYRLPTEAEWEYSARGGRSQNDYLYSGSDKPSRVAIYSEGTSRLVEVGKKSPNDLGIYDMSGNAWEWCNDGYSEYEDNIDINPIGDTSSEYKIVRGGSWRSVQYEIRNAARDSYYPTIKNDEIGFRIARTIIEN